MDIKEKVIAFVKSAYENHAKDGTAIDDETITHLNEVMDTVMTLTREEDIICAAGLHEILEKTEITPKEIADEFNENISIIVMHITDCYLCNITDQENRLMEEENIAVRVASMPDYEQVIVLADFLSNARNLADEYTEVGEEIYEIHRMARDEFIYFYRSMALALNEFMGTKAWQEFDRITSDKPFANGEFPFDTKWMLKLDYELRTSSAESTNQFTTRIKDQIILLLLNAGVADDMVVPVVSRCDILEYDDDNPDEAFLITENDMNVYAIVTRPFAEVEHTINMKLSDLLRAATKSGVDAIVINPDDEYYVIVSDWVESVVYMADKLAQGEFTQNDDLAIISRKEENVGYIVSINRPTDEYAMNTICYFIKEIEGIEGDSVQINIKKSEPNDGIKQIRITSRDNSYMMELFYDMTAFNWENELDLAGEGLTYAKVKDLINKLCVLGKKDTKIPYIMNHFRNITEGT